MRKHGFTVFVGVAVLSMGPLTAPARTQGTGEKTYKEKCAGCHGADGKGQSAVGKALKVRDFCSPEVKKESNAELTEIIRKGKNKMPAFENKLSDAETKDVLTYIRSLCK